MAQDGTTDEQSLVAWQRSLQLSSAGGGVSPPDPQSTATALSSAAIVAPEAPRFAGPKHATLWAAQWTAPLMIASGLYVLGAHGTLSLGAFLFGTASSGALAGAARLWLGLRRRALSRAARSLALYATRTLGEEHEVTKRAIDACDALQQAQVVAGWDPMCLTRVEQGLQYTRELLERPALRADRRPPPPLPFPALLREAW